MKEPNRLIGKSDLIKRWMREVFMQTAEPVSTREATERMVNILDSTYVNEKLKHVAYNASQINANKRTMLLSLLDDFGELFYGTLGD